MTLINLANTYEIEDCIHCGFQFGMPCEFMARLRENHKSFFCPACGKNMYYPHKSKTEKLEEQLAREKQCCVRQRKRAASLSEDLEHERHRTNGYKGLAVRRQRALEGYTPKPTNQTPVPPQGGTGVVTHKEAP